MRTTSLRRTRWHSGGSMRVPSANFKTNDWKPSTWKQTPALPLRRSANACATCVARWSVAASSGPPSGKVLELKAIE
eukprot:5542428-Pyramimonas_sp.AAC.1